MTDSQAAIEVVRASPVVTYTGAVLAGINIADWVTILTVIYLVLQILLLIPKYIDWYKMRKDLWLSRRDLPKSE